MPEREGSISRREQVTRQIEEMQAELHRIQLENVDDMGIINPQSSVIEDRIDHLEEGIKMAQEELTSLDK